MKKEYDFTNAEQGRFYRPLEELDIPIYLDKEVKEFFLENLRDKDSRFSLNEIINSVIKKDIEMIWSKFCSRQNCKKLTKPCVKLVCQNWLMKD